MFPPIAKSTFSQSACRELARAASLAYHEPDDISRAARAHGATLFRFLENTATDTQGYVAANETDLVIAFRGTESNRLKDWITDADFRKRGWYGVRVHEGFAKALDSVYSQVFRALRDFRDREQNIWITGHSLGGALAQLCAWRFRELDLAGVYTFGQPRVGNPDFALHYGRILTENTFRLVHEQDLVPRLPGPVLARYHHAGTEIFLNNFGGVDVNPAWYLKLSNDAAGFWTEYRHGRLLNALDQLVADHAMDRYLERIWN